MATGPIVVFYVAAGGGHRAAAQALVEAGRARGLDIEAVDALSLAPAWFAKTYVGAHLFGSAQTPVLYGSAFKASNRADPLRDDMRRALDHAVGRGMVAYVRERRPAVVIATHFYPLVELGRLRLAGELDALLVASVTDYVTHAVWAVPGVDVYCAAPGRAVEIWSPTGWRPAGWWRQGSQSALPSELRRCGGLRARGRRCRSSSRAAASGWVPCARRSAAFAASRGCRSTWSAATGRTSWGARGGSLPASASTRW